MRGLPRRGYSGLWGSVGDGRRGGRMAGKCRSSGIASKALGAWEEGDSPRLFRRLTGRSEVEHEDEDFEPEPEPVPAEA